MKKRFILITLALVILSIAFYLWTRANGKTNSLTLYGNVDVRQVDLGFRVYGRVAEMPFEEGDSIEPDQIVAYLEKRPFSDQVHAQEANLASMEASKQNAQILLKRRCELISNGSISQEDLDDAWTLFEVAVENVKQARANLAIAQKDLHDTEIFSPTRGTVLTRIREPGSIVLPGESVYTLSISSPVWVRAFVHEPDLGLIYPGMKAEIITDTPGAKVYTGKIGFISPVSEFTPKTVETTELRTDLVYRIRIYADNPDYGLKQGMPVTVKLCFDKEPK